MSLMMKTRTLRSSSSSSTEQRVAYIATGCSVDQEEVRQLKGVGCQTDKDI
jgi:hypothetical protein